MNPFNPSFGKVPQIYLDREAQMTNLINEIKNPNSPYQTSLIYGMRGVGKTSFLTDASRAIANKENWLVIDIPMSQNMIGNLISAIYNVTDSKLQKLLHNIKGFDISLPGTSVKMDLDSQNLTTNYQYIFEEILKKLESQGKSLLITIDEVNATPAMVELASIYQIMIRKNYRIAMLMTGLPDRVSELQNNDVLTFLLRSGRIILSPLNPIDVKLRYQQVFSKSNIDIQDDVLNQMVKLVKGYAYAFQLLGYLLWNQKVDEITTETLTQILPEYKLQLYRNSYTKIYEEMSDKDREFASIMAKAPTEKVEISYIREKMAKSSAYVAQYRRRLKDSQIILAQNYGQVEFSLPLFAEFIKENEIFF